MSLRGREPEAISPINLRLLRRKYLVSQWHESYGISPANSLSMICWKFASGCAPTMASPFTKKVGVDCTPRSSANCISSWMKASWLPSERILVNEKPKQTCSDKNPRGRGSASQAHKTGPSPFRHTAFWQAWISRRRYSQQLLQIYSCVPLKE